MSGIYIQNMEMPTGKVATIEIHPDGSVFTLRGRGIGNAVPVEDIRPVVHSFWVYNPGDNIPYCDNCGMPQDAPSDFCHSCGADMRPTSVSGAKELSKPRWIPVTEQLPEQRINQNTLDFEYVLCATTFGDVRPFKYGRRIGQGDAHFWNGAGYVDAYVTHWMPLPQPPKKET